MSFKWLLVLLLLVFALVIKYGDEFSSIKPVHSTSGADLASLEERPDPSLFSRPEGSSTSNGR